MGGPHAESPQRPPLGVLVDDQEIAQRVAGVLARWDRGAEPLVTTLTGAGLAGAIDARLAARSIVAWGSAPWDAEVREVRRLGAIRRLDAAHPAALLQLEQLVVLDAIGAGATMRDAARAAHLSLRTAQRRLAAALELMGAQAPVEALRRLDVEGSRLRAAVWSVPPVLRGRRDLVREATARLEADGIVGLRGAPGTGRSTLALQIAEAASRPWTRTGGLATFGSRPLALLRLGVQPGVDPGQLAARLDGTVLVVDDVDLVDEASWSVLGALVGRVPLVLVERSGIPSSRLPTRDGVIEVDPIGDIDARELIGASGTELPEHARAEVISLAGGRTDRLVDLSSGDLVDRWLATRVGHLDLRASASLRRGCALLGNSIESVPRSLLGAPVTQTFLDLDLARIDGRGGVLPAGARTRTALAAAADDVDLSEVHVALAAEAADATVRASHLLRAGRGDDAREVALRAFQDDVHPTARARALSVLAQTEPVQSRTPRVIQAVRGQAAAGRVDDALALLDWLDQVDPDAARGPDLVAARALVMAQRDQVDAAIALVEAALAAAREGVDVTRLRVTRTMLGLLGGSTLDGMIELADVSRGGEGGTDDGTALLFDGLGRAFAGDPSWVEIVLPGFEASLDRVRRGAGGEPVLGVAAELAGFLLSAYGDPLGAIDVLDRAIEALAPRQVEGLVAQVRISRAFRLLADEGPSDINLAELRACLTDGPPTYLAASGWASLAVGEADRGRAEEAARCLALAAEAPGDANGDLLIRWAEAELAYLAGRADSCWTIAVDALAGSDTFLPGRQILGALAAWAAIDLDPAPAAWPDVPPSPFPIVGATPDLIAGARALGRGDAHEAVDAFAAAVERPGQMFRDHLRQRWGLGEALRRAGRMDEARAILVPLADELTATGMATLLERVRASLVRIDRPVSAAPSVHGLTARQIEILRLVGAGLTSKQIAARLHLAPITVDGAVKAAMVRLDVRSRKAAAALVARTRA